MNRKEYFVYLDGVSDRLRIRYDIDKGKVIDFVIQYESFLNNKWIAIVRYDCAHGFFHRDELFAKGEQIKTEIDIQDLNSAALYAEQDLRDRWNWYKEQYLKHKKK
jgi:hypothetical protein